MRVFVAGASGVIGRRLVPQLIGAGHEVTGMTRRPERTARLRADGAEAVTCDAYDRDALREAVADARPEVVVHELTDLPPDLDPRKARKQYPPNNRVRREGTRNLMDAALATGTRRFVAQSVAFLYAPEGERVKDESGRPFDDAPGPWGEAIRATLDLERAVTGSEGIEGVVLRYGFFYGPGTSYAPDGHTALQVRKRRFPIIGTGTGLFSFIHVDDAAAATVAAVERGAPGIYNVCDDEPAPLAEWLPAFAETIGAKPPRRLPAWLARLLAGSVVTGMSLGMRGASSARAKRELGWEPRYPSWRQGFREAPE